MPTIRTKRLELVAVNHGRIMDDSNLGMMVMWLNNQHLMRYSEQRHKRHTKESQAIYINSFYWPNSFYEIFLDGGLVGTITVNFDLPNEVADLGILIGPTFQGNGYGLEAWKGLSDDLLKRTRKIEAGCMEINKGMIAIFEKSGMTREAYRPKHFMLNEFETTGAVYYGRMK